MTVIPPLGKPSDVPEQDDIYPEPVSAQRHVGTQPVKVSRDRAQYTRQQKGHSLVLHLTLGVFVMWIPAMYYSVSPNHFWHL